MHRPETSLTESRDSAAYLRAPRRHCGPDCRNLVHDSAARGNAVYIGVLQPTKASSCDGQARPSGRHPHLATLIVAFSRTTPNDERPNRTRQDRLSHERRGNFPKLRGNCSATPGLPAIGLSRGHKHGECFFRAHSISCLRMMPFNLVATPFRCLPRYRSLSAYRCNRVPGHPLWNGISDTGWHDLVIPAVSCPIYGCRLRF